MQRGGRATSLSASKFAFGRPIQRVGAAPGQSPTPASFMASPVSAGWQPSSLSSTAALSSTVAGHVSSDAFDDDDEHRSTKAWWEETNDPVAELAMLRHVIFRCRRSVDDKVTALLQDHHVGLAVQRLQRRVTMILPTAQ